MAKLFAGEAAFTTRGDWLERLQLGCADGEDVAMAGEPVGLGAVLFFPLRGVAEVEDLHFDAALRKRAGLDAFKRFVRGPDEDAGVAAFFVMLPRGDEFEVRVLLLRADDADGLAG